MQQRPTGQFEIFQLRALQDNYIFIIRDLLKQKTAVIDPADAEVVLEFLKAKNWQLDYVLNTHHHFDHVGGNLHLQKQTGCQIVGAKQDAARIPGISILLNADEGNNSFSSGNISSNISGGSIFNFADLPLQVFAMSGHTQGHIAYYTSELEALFCGDVLFGLGCGRIFEGTHAQMYKALKHIQGLPLTTKIYCAHEYAELGIAFALKVDPDNIELQRRVEQIRKQRLNGLSTVPLLLREELATNPFLRCHEPALQKRAGSSDELEVFTYLRNLRDQM